MTSWRMPPFVLLLDFGDLLNFGLTPACEDDGGDRLSHHEPCIKSPLPCFGHHFPAWDYKHTAGVNQKLPLWPDSVTLWFGFVCWGFGSRGGD